MMAMEDDRMRRLKLLRSLEEEQFGVMPPDPNAGKLGSNMADFGMPPPPPQPMQRPVMPPPLMPAADDGMGEAVEADRQQNNRRVMETAARQFIAGMTQTPTVDTYAQPGDAVANLRKSKAQSRLDALKDLEMGHLSRRNDLEESRQKLEMQRMSVPRAEKPADPLLDARKGLLEAQTQRALRVPTPKTTKPEPGPGGNFKAGNELRKEFDSLPEVKQFKDVSIAYDKIRSAIEKPSAAGDVSLVYGYMKLLDPGSTVREGELAMAGQATGIPGQIVNAYNKAVSGERIGDAQRQDFLRQAEGLYRAQKSKYDIAAQRYRDLAGRQNAAPDDVASESSRYEQKPAAASAEPKPGDTATGANGEKYVLNAAGTEWELVK